MKPDEETPTYRREIGVRVRFTHKKVSLIMRDLDLALFIVIYRHFIKRLVHLNPVLKCFDSIFFRIPSFYFKMNSYSIIFLHSHVFIPILMPFRYFYFCNPINIIYIHVNAKAGRAERAGNGKRFLSHRLLSYKKQCLIKWIPIT